MELEIPAFNLFMMCEQLWEEAFRPVPAGYSVRKCRKGELEDWIALNGEDPAQHSFLWEYYHRVYEKEGDLFFQKCTFVCDQNDRPVGTCFLWKGLREDYHATLAESAAPTGGFGLGTWAVVPGVGRGGSGGIPHLSPHPSQLFSGHSPVSGVWLSAVGGACGGESFQRSGGKSSLFAAGNACCLFPKSAVQKNSGRTVTGCGWPARGVLRTSLFCFSCPKN